MDGDINTHVHTSKACSLVATEAEFALDYQHPNHCHSQLEKRTLKSLYVGGISSMPR